MDTNSDAATDLADALADTRVHQPFALMVGRSPRTALRRYARALGLPEYASVAVLNEVEGERNRGRRIYRDLYTPYVPSLAAVLRGHWAWPDMKWERTKGRWAFTDDVPASEIIAVARRYMRYIVFVDDLVTRVYEGACDAPELERRLHATELWPEPVLVPVAALLAAISARLPLLDTDSVAVLLPPEEPDPHRAAGRFVPLRNAVPGGRDIRDLSLAVRGPAILTQAAELERTPVLVEVRVAQDGALGVVTSLPIRDRASTPEVAATMLSTLRHFGAAAREYARLVVAAP